MNGETRELYSKILEFANYFLVSAKRYEIRELQNFDPSFEELAEIMTELGRLVYDLVFEQDPHLASQSEDYVLLMKNMAVAIGKDDKPELTRLINELEGKSFVLPESSS